jgi:SAM-dependent methyltransferase
VRLWNAVARRNVVRRMEASFGTVDDWRGLSVLDVGCGTGRYLERAAARGAEHVYGVDSSASMIELARRRLDATGSRVDLVVGCFPDVDIRDRFDVVLVVGVLDYVQAPIALLRTARELCVGRVIVTVPWLFAARVLPRWMYWRCRGQRTRYYRRATLMGLFGEAGLTVERLDRIGPILFAVGRPDEKRLGSIATARRSLRSRPPSPAPDSSSRPVPDPPTRAGT